jgi:hypothetical protein
MRIINEAKNNYISEKKKEERKPEDGIKRQIEKLIKESGYLLAKKVLTEELDKLNEIIEEQKSNLREAEEKKYGIKIYQVDFIRAPYDPRNYKAYRQIKAIMEREKFDLIHCNTPIGGIIGRLAAKKCGIKKNHQ